MKRHKQLGQEGTEGEREGEEQGRTVVCSDLGGVLLMTNLMEPHFPSAVHLTAPVWTLSPSPLPFISLFLWVL